MIFFLVPTLDIELIWQTHLLRPNKYREDCKRLYGRVINHDLVLDDISSSLKIDAFKETIDLYEKTYLGEKYTHVTRPPFPKKPRYDHPPFGELTTLIEKYSYFDTNLSDIVTNIPSLNNWSSPFSFTENEVIMDLKWFPLCTKFVLETEKSNSKGFYTLNNVSMTAIRVNRFRKSYEKFLYLSAKYPPRDSKDIIHPSYAIDIIWHSHMQNNELYWKDMNRIFGFALDHHPWPLDCSLEESKKNCDETNSIWKSEFGLDMTSDHCFQIVNQQSQGSTYDWEDY